MRLSSGSSKPHESVERRHFHRCQLKIGRLCTCAPQSISSQAEPTDGTILTQIRLPPLERAGLRWTTLVVLPQITPCADRCVPQLLARTGRRRLLGQQRTSVVDGGSSTEFLSYSLSPTMLTQPRTRWRIRCHLRTPCQGRFGGCSPLFFIVPHLFWCSSARQRTPWRWAGSLS